MADNVPAFDDIPSFDDLPDAPAPQAQAQQSAVPKFDDIPDFDALPDTQRPAPEGPARTALRAGAHAVVPGAGALIGMGAGAAIGAPVGGVGAIVGGVIGGVLGGMGADVVQNKALDAADFNDAPQRQVNEQENPKSALGGELAGAMLGMSPTTAGTTIASKVAQRAAGGVMMGGFQAGQDYLNDGTFDPTKAGMAATAGVVLPGVNRIGSKLVNAGARMVPGRPNRTSNPNAQQTHVDVDDPSVETAVGDSVLAESPPVRDGSTTGNPQSAPERSERAYPKDNAKIAPEADMLTQGDMDPATNAALDAANPAVPPPAEAAPHPEPTPAVQPPARPPEPVVEAGVPQPGEPVAVGENEATAMPPARPMPELKGQTAPNDSISDAQKAAGNYQKARTHDFGKPMKVETQKGDTRRSPADAEVQWENKSPADYGYFNKTMGADKDHVDFYRAEPGSPEAGDKHFIVDQKNADTGKFDEHKVMTYFKDLDAARDTYLKGFSDDKAMGRLHDITEVDRKELTKWLGKPGRKTKPYGEPLAEVKEKAAPKVVQKAIETARAEGKIDVADAIEKSGNAVEAAKYLNAKTNKTGQSDMVTARIRPKPPEVPGAPGITAKSKADAKRKGDALAQMRKAVADNAPVAGETEMRPRLEKMVKDAGNSTLVYKPTVKPPEYLLIRHAKDLLARKTWKREHVTEFEANEKLARSDNPEDHQILRGTTIDAGIARSKRGGDAAISDAENKNARFDIPHEEAESMVEPKPVKTKADLKELPRKTIDVAESPLAIDTKAISKDALSAAAKRKSEAAALAGKKSENGNAASETLKAGEGRSLIKTADPKELQKYIDQMNNIKAKPKGLDALPAERELRKGGMKDLLGDFVQDEGGSLDIQKIRADIAAGLKRTEHKTYLAKKSNGQHDDYIRNVGEELHRISQEDRSHSIGLLHAVDAMPFTAAEREQIFHARDADSARVDLPGKQAGMTNVESLPADLKARYDEHLKPVLDQNQAAFDTIRTGWPDRMGADVEHHMSHIQKGDTSRFNMLKSKDDPMAPQYSGMSVNATAAKERAFMALERVSDGQRFVIQKRDNGFTLWDKYNGMRLKDPNFEFEANHPYQVPGKNGAPAVDYVMRNAMAREIEDNARGRDGKGKPMRYYKDAGFAASVTNAQLGSMARHLVELQRLTETPEFAKLATRNSKKADDLGWSASNLPNLKGWKMHPDLKAAFDDFAGHPQSMWRDLNSKITKLLFWMPTAHINNVGVHWFVGRGWDNLSVPKWYQMATKTLPDAIKSVVNQDAYQDRMRANGAGTIYGSVLTNDMLGQLARRFQQDIERDPGNWNPIAHKLGVKLSDLGAAVYRGSQHGMWASNDVFLTQRVMELERKGMSMKQAIIDAERDIPNYRLPIKILDNRLFEGRSIAQKVGDPAWVSFGRYHFGMMNSYAGIVKGALSKDATAGDRVEAVGKLMALGMMGMVIYPVLDKLSKVITGNEEATQQRRGPMAIVSHLNAARNGKEDIMSAMRATMTIPPAWSTAFETLFNKDFRGKQVVEPNDIKKGSHGDIKAAGRAGVQFGEHVARGLVSPLNTLETAAKKAEPGSSQATVPLKAIRDQAADVKNPSAAAIRYDKMSDIKNFRDSNTRFRKGGAGFIEGAYNKLVGK